MVQCENYQFYSIFLLQFIHTYTRSFILSAILFCVYHCAGRLTPKLQENFQTYMQCTSFKVIPDSPKHNSLICYFSSLDKTEEVQGNERKNQTFLKNRLTKNFQPSPWQTRRIKQKQNALKLNKRHGFKNFKHSEKMVICGFNHSEDAKSMPCSYCINYNNGNLILFTSWIKYYTMPCHCISRATSIF